MGRVVTISRPTCVYVYVPVGLDNKQQWTQFTKDGLVRSAQCGLGSASHWRLIKFFAMRSLNTKM